MRKLMLVAALALAASWAEPKLHLNAPPFYWGGVPRESTTGTSPSSHTRTALPYMMPSSTCVSDWVSRGFSGREHSRG